MWPRLPKLTRFAICISTHHYRHISLLTWSPALALLDTAFLADFPLPRPDILATSTCRAEELMQVNCAMLRSPQTPICNYFSDFARFSNGLAR